MTDKFQDEFESETTITANNRSEAEEKAKELAPGDFGNFPYCVIDSIEVIES